MGSNDFDLNQRLQERASFVFHRTASPAMKNLVKFILILTFIIAFYLTIAFMIFGMTYREFVTFGAFVILLVVIPGGSVAVSYWRTLSEIMTITPTEIMWKGGWGRRKAISFQDISTYVIFHLQKITLSFLGFGVHKHTETKCLITLNDGRTIEKSLTYWRVDSHLRVPIYINKILDFYLPLERPSLTLHDIGRVQGWDVAGPKMGIGFAVGFFCVMVIVHGWLGLEMSLIGILIALVAGVCGGIAGFILRKRWEQTLKIR